MQFIQACHCFQAACLCPIYSFREFAFAHIDLRGCLKLDLFYLLLLLVLCEPICSVLRSNSHIHKHFEYKWGL